MQKQQLRETLTALHDELAAAQSVDPETRQLLESLADDIRRLSSDDAKRSAADVDSASAEVQGLITKFEADHPELTRALNQVASALANLGI
jgi:hypothetical protein